MTRLQWVLVCAAIIVVPQAWGATLLVRPDGSGDYPHIRAAVIAAQPGDVIELADGVFVGSGNRNVEFYGKTVTVRSQSGDAQLCIIDCQSLGRAFRFVQNEGRDTRLEAVTIRNGHDEEGGAIRCFGSPTIVDCRIENCMGTTGGGLYCRLGSPLLSGCRFSGNSADYGAGLYVHLASPTLISCEVIANSAERRGAGVYAEQAILDVRTSSFSGNTALGVIEGIGGAMSMWQTTASVTGCTFDGNQALSGSAISACDDSDLTLEYSAIRGNGIDEGYDYGGVLHGDTYANLHLMNCTITGNLAGGLGCWQYSTAWIQNCTISGNQASKGGGVSLWASSDATCENTIIWGNCATLAGDEVFASSDCMISFACCATLPVPVEGGGAFVWIGHNVLSDPEFCGAESCAAAPTADGDYQLWNYSPCAQEICKLIGAQPVGCADPQAIHADTGRDDAARVSLQCRVAPNPFVGSTRFARARLRAPGDRPRFGSSTPLGGWCGHWTGHRV